MEPGEEQSQTAPPPAPPAPKFKTVFSTTGKVLLALFVIFLGLGILYGIVKAIGNAGSDSSSRLDADYTNTYLNSRTYYNQDADEAFTKMPLSQWKSLIASDIRGHCVRAGMTPDEVVKAVGKPTNAKTVKYGSAEGRTEDKGDVWEYTSRKVVEKPCSRYEGEKCADPVEYKTETATLYFSPNGHLTFPYLGKPLKTDTSDSASSTCY
jgi:hypothetical protein